MPRTSPAAVREIMKTNLDTPVLMSFISDAALWVDEEIATASPPPSAQRLEIIERYLACALCRLRELGLESTTYGESTENYQVDPEVTDYLLRAASFDPTGKIRQNFLAPKPVAQATPPTYTALARIGKGFTETTGSDQ